VAGGASEKARLVGADTVLEGSIRAANDRLRLSVQLSGADGTEWWSRRFDGREDDVFALEDEIGQAVVAALTPKLPARATPPSQAPTADAEARRLQLLGRQALGRRTETGFAEAADLFRRAVNQDPDFVLPRVGLAEAALLAGIYGLRAPEVVIPEARREAERALELRPGLGEALTIRATARALFDWDWAEAERDFLATLGRTAVPTGTRQSYAMYLLAPLGRFAEARYQLELARDQDPLAPALLASLGQVALFERRPEAALSQHRAALEIDPDFGPAHLFIGQALTELGQYPEAVQSLERAARISGRVGEVVAALGYAHGRAGDRLTAERLLAELEARASGGYLSPVLVAMAAAGLPDRARAVAALQAAARGRALDLVWLGVRPAFASLALEPGFQALRERLGLARPG
jgi:tetratricopeptide (TPR) repeat protein